MNRRANLLQILLTEVQFSMRRGNHTNPVWFDLLFVEEALYLR
jgi:hypothetical protein